VKQTIKKNKIALDIEIAHQSSKDSPSQLKPLTATTYSPLKHASIWNVSKSYRLPLSRKSITFISITLLGIGSYALFNYYYGDKSNTKKEVFINRYKS